MKKSALLPLLAMIFGMVAFQTSAQTFPCPSEAAKTANNFCIFLKWNGVAPPVSVLQNATVIYTGNDINNKDTVFTYLRGNGVGLSIDSAAVFKNTTQGGSGACNANPSSINLTSLAGQVIKFVYNGVTTTCFIASPLPIVLSSFDARLTGASSVQINWTTEVERDVNYFSVQRSTNGKDWKEISRSKPGTAESNTTKYYQHTDQLPADITEQVSYRLVTIDYSGATSFSETNTVKLQHSQGGSKVYPTITDGRINIRITSAAATMVLTDLMGARMPVTAVSNGMMSEMNIQALPVGMYLLNIYTQDVHESFKIMKQ